MRAAFERRWPDVTWTLLAFLSHWRRHPGVLAQLMAGLVVATALWSGVQALNKQARTSYDKAAHLLSSGATQSLVAGKEGAIPVSAYVDLKRQGYKASPVIDGMTRIGGRSVRIVGLEPLSLGSLGGIAGVPSLAVGAPAEFMAPPGVALLSPETARDLGEEQSGELRTASGEIVPPLKVSDDVPAGVMLVDIGVAERLLNKAGFLSRIILPQDADVPSIMAQSGGKLRLVDADDEQELQRLTGSFHLNLTAFGLLSFIVGLFIVNAAIGLAFEQRLALVRTVRAVGISGKMVALVLAFELLLLALLAGALGMVAGYGLAALLMPNVAASLSGLYGAAVPGTLSLEPSWWALGLLMTLAGTMAAGASSLYKAYRLPVLALAHPAAWREAQARLLKRQLAVAAGAALASAGAYWFGEGLVAGFSVIAGALLAAALLLPSLIAALLKGAEHAVQTPLLKWGLADGRQQLGGLSLALMALLLALSANVGVGTMVEGFRTTFRDWLDRRLFAEIYVEAATDRDAAALRGQLKGEPGVDEVLELARTEISYAGAPLEVLGASDHPRYRGALDLIEESPGAWERVQAGEAVFINEQMQRRLGLKVGDAIALPLPSSGIWHVSVGGFYADYGNPKSQVRGDHDAVVARFPDARRTSLGLLVAKGSVPTMLSLLEGKQGRQVSRVVDQAELKSISMAIFERTFAVTAALNVLTLAVSGIALLSTLLTLADARLAGVAPLWAMGVTRKRLAVMELARVMGLCCVTAIFAIPLGIFLAWCLVDIVNVRAFGWKLPLHVFPGQWATVFALALATGAASAILPLVRLLRTSPAALLKVFANER